MKKNIKTTAGGILMAIGTPLATAGAGWVQGLGMAMTSLGALLLGGAAADANRVITF